MEKKFEPRMNTEDNMDCTCKLLVKLHNIELDGAWGRGDQIYKDIWLTNDSEGCRPLLSRNFATLIGKLEFEQFRLPCVVVHSKVERADIEEDVDAQALLTSYLYLIQAFLNTLWVVKDHSVNFELGFLEVESAKEPPSVSSNSIGDLKSFASGGIRTSKFTRDELRTARDLFSKTFVLICSPDE